MSSPARPAPASDRERVLVADGDGSSTRPFVTALRQAGYTVDAANGAPRLLRALASIEPAVLLFDQDTLPRELLSEIARQPNAPAVVLLAGFGSVQEAVASLRAGAFDYLCKPVSDEQVLVSVARAVESRSLKRENEKLKADLDGRFELGRIVSRDPAFQRVLHTVAALSDTRATILIEGESGTGKTLLARTIHAQSSRRHAPFVEVNCGALPDALLESELFGHARGAFTGAVRDKAGKFEAADGGTLFLDEISTSSLDLQVKLLRVLQDRQFERLGEEKTRTSDVRVIAATNRDLSSEVAAGRFREDLYYRVHVVALRLPSLRERPGDVALLAEHFLARFAAEYARPARRFQSECLALFASYPWPGNVRELEHVIERAVLLCPRETIETSDLVLGPATPATGPVAPELARGGAVVAALCEIAAQDVATLRAALAGPERELIRRALEQNKGCRKATARMLGVNRTTLFNKMRKYKLMDFPIAAD
ncbi:MAG: sigma-54-dependent transcriptional regulator [Planctomycetota bacterium]